MTGAVHPLLDPALGLPERIRALYEVKAQRDDAALDVLHAAVDTTDSVLLQHEVLYNVGQWRQRRSLPVLERVVRDRRYSVVTRHEAIESAGAIGDPAALPLLREVAADPEEPAPITESCELAAARIELIARVGFEEAERHRVAEFASIDPAPAAACTVAEAAAALVDVGRPLFERYAAMFTLRNAGTPEAVAALCGALREDTSSCLFRHEVAFVLGQMESPRSVDALAAAVADEAEHGMVRHEAAEALGAIAEEETWPLLQRFAADADRLVSDSCVVAIEMHKYWSQFKPRAGAA